MIIQVQYINDQCSSKLMCKAYHSLTVQRMASTYGRVGCHYSLMTRLAPFGMTPLLPAINEVGTLPDGTTVQRTLFLPLAGRSERGGCARTAPGAHQRVVMAIIRVVRRKYGVIYQL